MSSPLAIAAVSAVLKGMLTNGITRFDLAAIIGTVRVTARAPDRVFATGATTAEPNQLNLFLYNVVPNGGWRNVDLPSRDVRGNAVAHPPLALDLHYLLTAYGAEDFNAEALLGVAMQLMHETPVLSRTAIREAIAPTTTTPSVLPAPFASSRPEDLAEQVELIKITPQVMSTEEMSKLWSAFQTHYRPTAAYQVSVVLIDSKRPVRAPLPVLTRGPVDPATQRERGVVAQPSPVPQYPTLLEARPPQSQPVVRMGETLGLTGLNLQSASAEAVFRNLTTQDSLRRPAVGAVSPTEISIDLPAAPGAGPFTPPLFDDPDLWRIGQYAVSAVLDPGQPQSRTTNEVPLTLAPVLEAPFTATSETDGSVTITVTVRPSVWRGQIATLVVGEQALMADPLTTDRTAVLTFRAAAGVLASGPQVLRLRVDGVETVITDRTGPVPTFIATLPTVAIP